MKITFTCKDGPLAGQVFSGLEVPEDFITSDSQSCSAQRRDGFRAVIARGRYRVRLEGEEYIGAHVPSKEDVEFPPVPEPPQLPPEPDPIGTVRGTDGEIVPPDDKPEI